MEMVLSRVSAPSFGHKAAPELERRPFDQNLWAQLEAMEIDPADATTRFQHRLKQYNKWTDEFAARVTKEYRRFLYLAARAGHPVTPSDTVDQAWHLHLIYTRHYWNELCGKILGFPLHHEPSAGGRVESNKFERQYEQTIESYKAAFGETPPADIWPVREPAKLRALGKKLVVGGTVVGMAIAITAAKLPLLIFVAIAGIIVYNCIATAALNPGMRSAGCGAAGSGGHAAAGGSCGSSGGGSGCGGGGCGGGCGG